MWWAKLSLHDPGGNGQQPCRLNCVQLAQLVLGLSLHVLRRGAVVIHGDEPEVAAPWRADARALAADLVGRLGAELVASTIVLGPFGAARQR